MSCAKVLTRLVVLAFVLTPIPALATPESSEPDPYLWLEDVLGERAIE